MIHLQFSLEMKERKNKERRGASQIILDPLRKIQRYVIARLVMQVHWQLQVKYVLWI